MPFFLQPALPRPVGARKGTLFTESPAAPAANPEPAFLTCCPVQLSGLALFAETVWVTADQYRVYPLMGVSGKDDVFAGAWIAIFCGFSFFVVASFGVGAALCRRRSMILTVRPRGAGHGDGWARRSSTRNHSDNHRRGHECVFSMVPHLGLSSYSIFPSPSNRLSCYPQFPKKIGAQRGRQGSSALEDDS